MKNQLKTELNNYLKKGKSLSMADSQSSCLGADWTETVLSKQQKKRRKSMSLK